MEFVLASFMAGYIYLIRFHSPDLIKIGYTSNPRSRIYSHYARTSRGFTLQFLAPGTMADEVKILRVFKPYRIYSELFEGSAPLEWIHLHNALLKPFHFKLNIGKKSDFYSMYDCYVELVDNRRRVLKKSDFKRIKEDQIIKSNRAKIDLNDFIPYSIFYTALVLSDEFEIVSPNQFFEILKAKGLISNDVRWLSIEESLSSNSEWRPGCFEGFLSTSCNCLSCLALKLLYFGEGGHSDSKKQGANCTQISEDINIYKYSDKHDQLNLHNGFYNFCDTLWPWHIKTQLVMKKMMFLELIYAYWVIERKELFLKDLCQILNLDYNKFSSVTYLKCNGKTKESSIMFFTDPVYTGCYRTETRIGPKFFKDF